MTLNATVITIYINDVKQLYILEEVRDILRALPKGGLAKIRELPRDVKLLFIGAVRSFIS